eukprot:1789983-Heterocapsa_arctica.AAC.1
MTFHVLSTSSPALVQAGRNFFHMPLNTVSASAAPFEGSGSGLGGFQKGTSGTQPGVYWAHWTQWAQTPDDQLTPILPVLARKAGFAGM